MHGPAVLDMDILPALLWSDVLIWTLVLLSLVAALLARRSEPLRRGWAQVGRKHGAMAAATLLAVFVCVGLLDSLHYRERLPERTGDTRANYAVELRSLLDLLLSGLRSRSETSYSQPLATRLYNKDALTLADGRQVRDYPRLRHGGAHLGEDEGGRGRDIAATSLRALLFAGLAWLAVAATLATILARRQGATLAQAWRRLWHGQTALAWRGVLLALAGVFAVVAVLAALSAGYHALGTDKVGQDVLYLALKSVRTALIIGLLTTLVLLPLALSLGVIAGYFRGWVDDLIQYLYTTISSVPSVLLVAAAVLMMQVIIDSHAQWFSTSAQRADVRLLALCLILGMTSWTGLCRLLRGETLKLSQLDYVQAAHALGLSHWRVLLRHILPNLLHIVLITLVMDFSQLVLAEAVLSYVGIGVDPTTISFGTMINSARMELAREPMVWWSLAAAFSFMLCLVLAANLLADAVRDAFDPQLAGSS